MEELEELRKIVIAELKRTVQADTWQCEGINSLNQTLDTITNAMSQSRIHNLDS